MDNYNLHLNIPWPEVREKIKEANVEISDEDLRYEKGNEKSMLEHLSRKTGMTVEEVKNWIESVAVNKGKAS